MISGREEMGAFPVKEGTFSPPANLRHGSLIVMVLCLLFFAALSLWRLSPPKPASAAAPPMEFSSERAMNHVRAIAQKPHPIGSAEHALVRDYIQKELIAQGLSPEAQESTALDSLEATRNVATIHNIIGRLRGENNTKALLLAAHYDSAPNSPGVGNDAAAATSLSAAR